MPRLLIFDNCEDPQVLARWAPTIGGCRILVTARRTTWPHPAVVVPLGGLARSESRDLLQRLDLHLTTMEAVD